MPKGWRVELADSDGNTDTSAVGLADLPKAIKAAIAYRAGSKSVTVRPLSDEECRTLSLKDGQVVRSDRIREDAAGLRDHKRR